MKRLKRAILFAVCASILAVLVPFSSAQAASSAAHDDFFTDSVFLGDSITVGLEEYVDTLRSSSSKAFSNALFLAKNSYGVRTSMNDDGSSYHPSWKGEQYQPQKSIARIGNISKVFIMLGTNDIKEDHDDIIDKYKTLVGRIKDAVPGVTVYIQSVLPMTSRKEDSQMSNRRIDSFNEKLARMCSSLNLNYIDVASSFKDSNGSLRSSYSSDDYVHISKEGYQVWVDVLRDYAAGKSSQGKVMNVSSSLNMRSSPSTSASIVTKLRNNATVTIEEAFIDYEWHKVSVNGKSGYLHKDFVYLDSVSYSKGTVIKVNDFVNARSKPNTNSDVVCTINKGKEVKVVRAYSTSNWYLVYYNDAYMYVRKDFISLN
ncbi:MAG: GDSL-type esterase/lipase family protein [Christensenellales bacterium]|jgi:lysophospholipase L1-like esterase/uncharacterized protein YraI